MMSRLIYSFDRKLLLGSVIITHETREVTQKSPSKRTYLEYHHYFCVKVLSHFKYEFRISTANAGRVVKNEYGVVTSDSCLEKTK